MPSVLFLDDMAARHEVFEGVAQDLNVFHVHTAARCIKLLEANSFDGVCLDHDLAEEHYDAYHGMYGERYILSGTGMDVAEWLRSHPAQCPPVVWIHSWNSPAAERMAQAIRGIPKRFMLTPFGPQSSESFCKLVKEFDALHQQGKS